MGHFPYRKFQLIRRVCLARVFRLAMIVAGLLFGLPRVGLSQPNGTLSVEVALRAVAEKSLHVRAHESSAASSREMAVVARQLPDPVLRVSLDNVPVEGSAQWSLQEDFMTMQTVGLMQTFVAKGKREALSDRYEQEARLADAERTVELTGLQRATAQAWFDRYYQERVLQLLRDQRAEASLLVATTEAVYRSGQVTQMDVLGARAEVALLDDQIRGTEIELENAIATLERWIGESARLPLSSMPALADLDVSMADAARQAESLWLAQQEELALAETRLARMNRHSDWNVELMYGKRGPAFEDMVSLGFSIPLQLGRRDKQDRELAASLADLDSVRRLRSEQLNDYQLQIQTWLHSWRGNLDRLSSYDMTLLPLARDRTEAALSAYRGNRAALSEVLGARQAEIEMQLERTSLEKETAGLWVQLRFLMPVTGTDPIPNAPADVNDDSQE